MKLYPLLFKPNLHPVVWGGSKLITYKGLDNAEAKDLNPGNLPIGESWEVSAVPSSKSVVANGEYEGIDLDTLIHSDPIAFLGEVTAVNYNYQLPLLVKFIDAEQDLSIQVHPNDEMAKRMHGKMGKSEMWYIIDAKPGSYLYAGFKEKITPEQYCDMVENGTICNVLAKHEVKAGDVFYLPAGRVHAICGGILLAEVQQSSDVTYRIYDYNRPGIDGKPRELHTELAAEALDFEVMEDYRTHYADGDNRSNLIIGSPYFSARVTELNASFHRDLIKYDSFIISTCIDGDCTIKIRTTGDSIELHKGNSCFIPAAIANYDVIPLNNKPVRVLDAFIDNMDRSLAHKVTRFLHLTKK